MSKGYTTSVIDHSDAENLGIDIDLEISIGFNTETTFEDHGLPGNRGEWSTEFDVDSIEVDGEPITAAEMVARFGAKKTLKAIEFAEQHAELEE